MLPTFQRVEASPDPIGHGLGGRADNDVSLIITKDSATLEEEEKEGEGTPKLTKVWPRGDFRDWERRL